MSEGSLLLQFIVIIVLTGINAFFSGAEMSIVSVNKNKIKVMVEEGDKKAILLDNLLKERKETQEVQNEIIKNPKYEIVLKRGNK